MAVRTDVTVNFSTSPRVVTVASPSVEISIQDLHDTLRDFEKQIYNMSFLKLVNSAGKNVLGGGVFVGVTLTLQNTRLAFEARPGPAFIQCTVSGGNIVAVDASQVVIDSIMTTAFTQVIIEKASGTTLLSADTTLLEGIEKLLRNKIVTDPILGTITVYADNGIDILLTAPLWEDAAGTIPYRGKGSERRDRMI